MRGFSPRSLRTAVAVGAFVLVCVGIVLHLGFGSPSTWGFANIAAICPLGAVEASIASKTLLPPTVVGMAIVIGLIIFFGGAFCAWVCPMTLIKRVLGLKNPEQKALAKSRRDEGKASGGEASSVHEDSYLDARARSYEAEQKQKTLLDIPASQRGGLRDSRNWVLFGAIASTAAFGFPVFCLICPVGLSIGLVVALWDALSFGDFSLSLIVFPLVIILEATLLRKWCHHFCPIAALASLIARANRSFRPVVDKKTCLVESKGLDCHRCSHVCPEGVDLHDAMRSAPMSECIKCGECKAACPAASISFPFLAGADSDRKREAQNEKA